MKCTIKLHVLKRAISFITYLLFIGNVYMSLRVMNIRYKFLSIINLLANCLSPVILYLCTIGHSFSSSLMN